MEKKVNTQVTGDGDYVSEWGMKLECPIEGCGFDYVHIEHPYLVKGKDAGNAWTGRGDAMFLSCYCEENHRFLLRIGEHKGQTFMGYEPHPEGDERWTPTN